MRKRRAIEERLESIERSLANAQEYLAQGVNVEGSSWLHFDDWEGKSGHPAWMKNHMIPRTLTARARNENALRNLDKKAKDKHLTQRKRRTTS